MLALARERYTRGAVDTRDLADIVRYPGTWRVLARYPGAGLKELGYALSPTRYLRAVQRYCPSLTLADLLPCQSGIRAQAVSRDGRLIHDFLLRRTPRTLHVCNAPSPAATAALPIADEIVARLLGPS
jgi:L-2-hydroxyglutarate oxidase